MNVFPLRAGVESSAKESDRGRWSEFSVVEVDQSKVSARGVCTKATSGEELEIGRVAKSGLFMTVKPLESTSPAMKSPRASPAPRDHSSLWPLISPKTIVSADRSEEMDALKPGGEEEAGGT